jgi:hypothetical protein
MFYVLSSDGISRKFPADLVWYAQDSIDNEKLVYVGF